MLNQKQKNHMLKALEYGELAFEEGEVPVGAVVTYQDKIIGFGYNQRENAHNITGHAEIMALNMASQKLKSWKLDECEIYITLEPCLMCYGAIKQSRIKNIYIGLAANVNKDYTFKKYVNSNLINEEIHYGLYENEILKLMQTFFKNKR